MYGVVVVVVGGLPWALREWLDAWSVVQTEKF